MTKLKSYIDFVNWTWYICLIVDIWLYQWPDCIPDTRLDIWFCIHWLFYYLCLICYFCFIPVYMFHSLLIFICTCTFPFILIHSLGVLTPWICISRYGCFIYLIRFQWDRTCCEDTEFSLFDFWYSYFLISAIVLWFLYIRLSFYSISYFIWDHV